MRRELEEVDLLVIQVGCDAVNVIGRAHVVPKGPCEVDLPVEQVVRTSNVRKPLAWIQQDRVAQYNDLVVDVLLGKELVGVWLRQRLGQPVSDSLKYARCINQRLCPCLV